MKKQQYDLIVIGCGSGGLSVGLFMGKAGFRVLMVSKSDHAIGGDCLNDGCVPSKALIHVASVIHAAKEAAKFGMQTTGNVDLKKALAYVRDRQEVIRKHENASWLQQQGVDVALGTAFFTGTHEIEVDKLRYSAKKIVIATGSRPRRLTVPGVEKVAYFDNETIFHLERLPGRLLVVGGGPIGVEMAQVMSRLGSQVTVVQKGNTILPQDDLAVTGVLYKQMEKEGICFLLNAAPDRFLSATEAVIRQKDGTTKNIQFDAVFVAIGRELNIEELRLEEAAIEVKQGKILADNYLRTTNKDIYLCGDVAGSLLFSHAAEYHARILLHNFFSPRKKKLHYDHFSWVTFTQPEVASFGLSEKVLEQRGIVYERLEESFADDDRAVVDNHRWGKLVLFIEPRRFARKQKILGGTVVAPQAGELIQELILANAQGLSVNAIFDKIYPYPVASRINQRVILNYKQERLTTRVKKLLRYAFRLFS